MGRTTALVHCRRGGGGLGEHGPPSPRAVWICCGVICRDVRVRSSRAMLSWLNVSHYGVHLRIEAVSGSVIAIAAARSKLRCATWSATVTQAGCCGSSASPSGARPRGQAPPARRTDPRQSWAKSASCLRPGSTFRHLAIDSMTAACRSAITDLRNFIVGVVSATPVHGSSMIWRLATPLRRVARRPQTRPA